MEKKKSKRRKKIIIFSAVIILIGIIIFFNLRAQREKAVKVTVEKVKRQNLTSIVSASGEVKPKKNINISAHIPGRIVKIGVEEGERVKAGDFLLKLDSAQYEANADRDRALIRSYKAELIQAEARLKKDENYFYRQKKLFDEKLISKEQLEAAKAQYDISYAQYEAIRYQIKQAEASLQSTLDNLNKTVYYSPIDGIITSLRVEEGEVAMIGTMNNPGTILMTIADLSVMEVEVEVDETDVVNVRLAQPAEVRIDAFPNLNIEGKVTEVGSSALQKITASEESKDFKVVITLDNPPESLKPGLSASADIITAEKKDVLAVPISALVLREKEGQEEKTKEEQEEGVYVIDRENRVKFRHVKKGIMGEMMVEIASGLEEGDEIVVGPYDSLRQLKDGVLIKPEEKKEKG
ncbi:MAG: efflux RND transporter periplasmic adaptor subunit [Candidatus Aminicenantales bacterium]